MYGEYEHTIDAKGRMFLPSKFRTELGERVYVTMGLDGCICIYPTEEWNKFIKKLDEVPSVRARHVKRYLCRSAVETDVDAQGRILIPLSHREKAKLGRTVTVIGVDEKAEVWNPDDFRAYSDSISDEEITAELIELGM